MSAPGFVVTHAAQATFERGLRSFFEYRDLGIRQATNETTFQLVYVLKGWIEFEYEGQGVVRLEAGSCVHQPPGIRHREIGHSPDVELLEVVMPGEFATVEVPSVEPAHAA
jgi:mannose-6-phosphate isomerase-like protein (cupin superfamily)